MMVKKLLQEPLLHLILMGGVLFGVYGILNPDLNKEPSTLVSKSEVARFLEQKASEVSEPLSEMDKAQLLESYINDEILYHEAKRIGLDHDAFIRERLIQKARFYLEGQFVVPEVNEDTLRQFYQENLSSYQKKKTISFEHRILNADGVAQIRMLLDSDLPEDEFLARVAPFQKKSLLSPSFENASMEGLLKVFGGEFAEEVQALPINQWSGLVESKVGFHIVKVTSLNKSGVQEFDEVKDKVKEDWIMHQRNLWVQQHIKTLWKENKISIDDFLPNA